MAEDAWKAAGFTQEQQTAPVTAPAPNAPPMPYTPPEADPKDTWALAGMKRIQGDGSPTILPHEVAAAKQVAAGKSIMSGISGSTSPWAGRLSPLLDSIHSTLTAVPDAMWNQLEQGAQAVGEGQQDILQNRTATGIGKVALGLGQALWSPVLGIAEKVGEQATKVTGDQVFGEKTALALSLVSPFPEGRPLIRTASGDLARLHTNEAGQLDASLIGKPPVAADFHNAARQITAYHGSSHDFEQFDLRQIGTGEGAQSYGHGLYFAENPKVAQSYSMDPSKFGTAGDKAGGGNYYKVSISADPTHFLDWDKPLSEQSPRVQEALKKVGDKLFGDFDKIIKGDKTGRQIYEEASGVHIFGHGPDLGQAASKALAEAGIPGIKYLDQGSRGKAEGTGTRNFVVFDDKLVKIAEKNGAPLSKDEQVAMVEQKLHSYWNDHGVHPAEVAEIAAGSEAHAADLSAAHTGPLPLPQRRFKQFLHKLSDDLFSIRGAHTADQEEVLDHLTSTIPTPFKDGEVQDRAYRAAEGDTTATLSPEEKKIWDEQVQPARNEARDIFEWMKGIGLTEGEIRELDPNYMTRLVQGKTPEVDRFSGMADNSDPIYPPGTLARTTRSMRDRTYFAMNNAEGERRIIRLHNGPEGTTLETVSKDKTAGIITHNQKEPIHPGDKITVAGDEWTVDQALTREIEEATNTRYYKNGLLSVYSNLVQLRAAQRVVEALQRLKDSPEWAENTSVGKPMKEHWIQPEMPLLRNFYMEPKLAYEIDDFWGRRPAEPLAERLEKINSWAIKSLFWTPIPHVLNAASNWFVARSGDWINPVGFKRLAMTGAKAIHEVATMGPIYQRFQRDGASLIYGGLANKDFYQNLLEKTGAKMVDDTNFLDIARELAISPKTLVAGLYNLSAKGLWAASDMFTVQRIMELEEKGLSTAEAIKNVDKTMVNYRLPTTMLTSRILKEKYSNPSYFEFSRYHWGLLRGWGNMAKDIAVGSASEKADAVGRIMALGVLQLVVWPAMSEMLQQISGNPGLSVPSFGLGRLAYPVIQGVIKETQDKINYPPALLKYYGNDKDLLTALYTMAPLSPGIKMGLELVSGLDLFTGRNIAEPSDRRNLGLSTPEARNATRNWAGDKAAHAAGTMAEPLSMVDEAWKKGTPIQNLVLQHLLGITEHTEDQEAAKQRAFHYQDIQARKRHNKPEGLMEKILSGSGD